MKPTEPNMPNEVEELSLVIGSAGGAKDNDDDRDDEHAAENEIPVRETDEHTEAPEEFQFAGEDEPPRGDDADLDDDGDDDPDDDSR